MLNGSHTSGKPLLLTAPINQGKACEGQCDCACAEYPSSRTAYQPAGYAGDFVLADTFQPIPVEGEFFVTPGSRRQMVVLNQSALDLVHHFRHPQPLDRYTNEDNLTILQQVVDLGLLVPASAQPAPFDSTTLTAWLHLTDRCTFRCAYCYLPHLPVDMDVSTGRAAIDATLRSARHNGYTKIKIKYAGGEPLLQFDLLLDLHHYALQRSQQEHIELDGVVLSNASLLDIPRLQALQANHLRLMISLDGDQNSDPDCQSQRATASGASSDAPTRRAIDLALAHGIRPDISITLTRHNLNGLPALVAWLLERDLPFHFNFYRHSPTQQPDLAPSPEALIVALQSALQGMETSPAHRSYPGVLDRVSLVSPHSYPCQAGHSALVFDPLGRISKCPMAMEQGVADCAHPDPISAIRNVATGLSNPPVSQRVPCHDCRWQYWCGGGCPLERTNGASPYCQVYAEIIPELLRMEARRLIKNQTP